MLLPCAAAEQMFAKFHFAIPVCRLIFLTIRFLNWHPNSSLPSFVFPARVVVFSHSITFVRSVSNSRFRLFRVLPV